MRQRLALAIPLADQPGFAASAPIAETYPNGRQAPRVVVAGLPAGETVEVTGIPVLSAAGTSGSGLSLAAEIIVGGVGALVLPQARAFTAEPLLPALP
jgi:hypothetical protein